MKNRFTNEWNFAPLSRPDDGTGSGAPNDPPIDPATTPDPATDPTLQTTQPDPQRQQPSRDWRDKEIARKHARNKTLEEENAHLRALVEAATRNAAAPPVAQHPVDPTAAPPQTYQAPYQAPNYAAPQTNYQPDQINRAIEARAEQISAARSLDDKLTDAVNAAKAKHGTEWDAAFDRIKQMGGIDHDTLSVIASTDAPHEVLFTLGHKPEEFQRIMDLPPHRRATELVKIGIAASTPTPEPKRTPSNAPEPVDPIRTAAVSGLPTFDLYDQKITTWDPEQSPWSTMKPDRATNDEQWFAKRAEEKAKSKGRPWSTQR